MPPPIIGQSSASQSTTDSTIPPNCTETAENKDIKIIENIPIEIALSTLPPSFARNEILKDTRKRKLEKAKRKLIEIAGGIKTENTTQTSPTKNTTRKTKKSKKKEKKQEDKEEELLIQKLLLQGVPEEEIINVPLSTLLEKLSDKERKPVIELSDSDSEELNEKDLPDDEVFQFIKTPQEIKVLQQLEKEKVTKKTKIL